MSLLIVMLLLVIVVLAAITRIVDSRPVMGLGMLALAMVLLVGVVSSQRRAGPVAVTVITTESVRAANARESVASPEADDAVDDPSNEPETKNAEPEDAESRDPETEEPGSEEPAAEAPADSGTGELSSDITVETGEIIIPPRPEWVEADEVQTGDIHTMAVSSGPHETERECRKALDRELQKAVDSYIDWHLGPVYDERFRASKLVRYEVDEIKQRLILPGKIYHEVIQVSFGPMHQMHAQLTFDSAFRRELDSRRSELEQHWKQWIVQQRLVAIAVGFGLLLALMGIVFTYFRLDTATRGFYSRRLKWAAAAGIAAVVAVAIVVTLSGALQLAKGAAILLLLTGGAVLAGRMLQK
jgi:hypothetical protein